jgi:hypothetical protein
MGNSQFEPPLGRGAATGVFSNGCIDTKEVSVAPRAQQRVFDGAETLAKLLILNGLLKFAKSRDLRFGTGSTWLPGSRPKPTRRAENGGKR